MATIIGAVASSHTPTIGFALDRHKQRDPVWAPIFEGYEPVQAWLAGKQPDVLLVVFTDGENDVAHPGDDAGLLAGNDGLEQVLQKARRKASQLPLTIITVGLEGRRTFNQEALRRLAFPADANTYYRAQNRSDLQRAFGWPA